jgi:hypothetical protein
VRLSISLFLELTTLTPNYNPKGVSGKLFYSSLWDDSWYSVGKSLVLLTFATWNNAFATIFSKFVFVLMTPSDTFDIMDQLSPGRKSACKLSMEPTKESCKTQVCNLGIVSQTIRIELHTSSRICTDCCFSSSVTLYLVFELVVSEEVVRPSRT